MFSEYDKGMLTRFSKTLDTIYMNWLHTTSDNDGTSVVRDGNIFISGGSLATFINDEETNDWDFYVKNPETAAAITKFYKESLGLVKMSEVYNKKLITANAITLRIPDKVQIVTMEDFSGHPKEVVNKFDYLHTTWYWDSVDKKLWVTPNILNACKKKHLYVSNPDAWTQKREAKLINRDWGRVEDDNYKKAQDLNIPF